LEGTYGGVEEGGWTNGQLNAVRTGNGRTPGRRRKIK
jgi:hypothetical protein